MYEGNSKLFYYLTAYAKLYVSFFRKKIDIRSLEQRIDSSCINELNARVNYYNKLEKPFLLPKDCLNIAKMNVDHGVYSLDALEYLKRFNGDARLNLIPGDVIDVPEIPSFVKSRPLLEDNQNSILLKLNKVRHFWFPTDDTPFEKKKNILVWRGACYQEHRIRFMKNFFDRSPLIDVGDFSNGRSPYKQWHVAKMSVCEQLKYKFILSIEGNDVATSTKWIMASNSLCFMTKPKFETWFMEGLLKPNFHYVMLKDDYSDLEDKIQYYIDNPKEAKFIIHNANNFVRQFMCDDSEDYISFKVIHKYLKLSGQLES